MIYEIEREVIKVATKTKSGLVKVIYQDTKRDEIFEKYFETYQTELTMQFITLTGTPDPDRDYTASEYFNVWKNVKETIHEVPVKVDYDRENKSAYVSFYKIKNLCDKYDAWERPDGTNEKWLNVDVEVRNNDKLRYVYIYNPKANGENYIEMEIDLLVDTRPYEEIVKEVQLEPDTTEYLIDAFTLEKIPIEEWKEQERERKGIRQLN